MPSRRRERSNSRDRSESRSRSRDPSRSRSPGRSGRVNLPAGAKEISESDYFLKSDEFRVWLREEKKKYLDELSGERSRKYFRKFVKAWNRGRLSKSLYTGVDNQPASSQTGYKWSFVSKTSKADQNALQAARDDVGSATHNRPSTSALESRAAGGSGRLQGPTLPSQSDLTLARESAEDGHRAERDYRRKMDRKEGKERLEEMVGPKEVGKEGMLEKKRAKREADKSFREKGDDGFEADETTLMGGGDSFRDHIARRDAARKRHEEKRFGPREDRDTANRERVDAIRQKDKATMDMFMQMAKAKFG